MDALYGPQTLAAQANPAICLDGEAEGFIQ